MATKERTYKLNLVGGDVTVKDREISESLARKIITLIMGGITETDNGERSLQSLPAGPGIAENVTRGGAPSPKLFMAQKRPLSELERITCLAFYLTHYRDMRAFKTRDLTKLNTEAAQPAFSNAAVFARNGVNAKFLSKAGGGSKQITVLGEAIVDALPDREKVKAAIEKYRIGRTRRPRKKGKKSN